MGEICVVIPIIGLGADMGWWGDLWVGSLSLREESLGRNQTCAMLLANRESQQGITSEHLGMSISNALLKN